VKKLVLALAAFAGGLIAYVPAHAEIAKGDILVRARVLGVLPDESATVTPIGGSVSIDESYVPEVDATYFLTNNIGVELIAAVTPHKVRHTPTGIDLGEVWLLPPTVTLQYHFNPKGKVKPYVGAGLNYTHFFNEDAPGGAITKIDYKDSWGWAAQAGVDFQLNDRWYLNIDVKKIKIEPDVVMNNGTITAEAKINPVIFGFGVGYRY
jgi:outer membrane protein